MLAGGIGQGYGEQKQQQQQDEFLKALLGQIKPVPQPGLPAASGVQGPTVPAGGISLRNQLMSGLRGYFQ